MARSFPYPIENNAGAGDSLRSSTTRADIGRDTFVHVDARGAMVTPLLSRYCRPDVLPALEVKVQAGQGQ